jgi:prepilin-type N-terminal cleavage/methylation domain-containing protein
MASVLNVGITLVTMKKMTKKQQGFTLIELMITLAIVAVLAMVAGPSMIDQINNSKVSSAQDNLNIAFSKAKSIAIRNQYSIYGDTKQDTAVVCIGSGAIQVFEASAGTPATCGDSDDDTYVWGASVHADIEFKHNSDKDLAQICFDNRGQINNLGGCVSSDSDSAVDNSYTIKLDGTSASVSSSFY